MYLPASLVKWTFLAVSSIGLLAASARDLENAASALSATNAPGQTLSPGLRLDTNSDDGAALSAALEYAAKQREDRLRGIPPPPSQFPFPNVYGEPLSPSPNYVNFYGIDDRYPDYLLCRYDVKVKNYHQSSELEWFKDALKQTRHSGPTKFPPIKWIAVAIQNVKEHKDANTFEQSFKVGAIFKATDVFDSSIKLSQLINEAKMDRHPFKFEPAPANPRLPRMPREEQHWSIVERHAATNSPSAGTK